MSAISVATFSDWIVITGLSLVANHFFTALARAQWSHISIVSSQWTLDTLYSSIYQCEMVYTPQV